MADFEINSKLTIPDDLTGVDNLDELKRDIVAAYAELKKNPDKDATLPARRDLSKALESVKGELERRATVARESDEIDAAFEELEKPEAEDEAPAAEEAVEDAPQVEAEVEQPTTDEDAGEAPEAATEAPPVTDITPASDAAGAGSEGRTAVAAAAGEGREKTMSEIGSSTKAPATTTARTPVLFAASDVPEHNLGAEMTMEQLATALGTIVQTMGSGPDQTRNVATIRRSFDERLVQSSEDVTEVARYAAQAARGELEEREGVDYAFTCAPAQTLDGICSRVSPSEGLASFPTIQLTRETIQWRRGIDWCDADLAGGFGTWTEAMAADADAVKDCARVTCLPPAECTVEPDWLCTITDIMKYRFDREIVTDFLEKQMLRYNRWRNVKKIASVLDVAGPAIALPEKFGAVARLRDALLLIATDIRKREGMSRTAPIHVKMPWETPELLMAAEGYRDDLDAMRLTLAQVTSFVAQHGVSVEFVYGLESLTDPAPSSPTEEPPQCAAPATDWFTTLPILAYPAGAWVAADADIINLQTVYDSTLLARNEFMLRFAEQTTCMIDTCPGTRLYTVPVCVNGTVGGRNNDPVAYGC